LHDFFFEEFLEEFLEEFFEELRSYGVKELWS